DDLAAELRGDVNGIDTMSGLLGRGSALRIECPAVGSYAAVGRVSAGAHGDEQGRVKPAAILVPALQVEVGRPGKPFATDYGSVAGAGFKPHVEDVSLFAEDR